MTNLARGDLVLVVRDFGPMHPRAGAVGEVAAVCDCRAIFFLEGYSVDFGERGAFCYPRPCLKKLDPPADAEPVETPEEVAA